MSSRMPDPGRIGPIYGPDWLMTNRLPSRAIICGSAPCLLEDFEKASAHMTDAAVLVVNEAGSAIHGDHLITQHPEKARWFRQRSLNRGITVHTGKPRDRANQSDIDVYWPDCITLATSGGSAMAIALRMKFERVVLCGMPMNGGDGYFEGSELCRDEPRFGLESPDTEYIQSYRKKLVEWASGNPEAQSVVRSMSGFTRGLFGSPEWAAPSQTAEKPNPEAGSQEPGF